MSKKLIRLLKQAHAIEIGAYNAYEGHYKSVKDPDKSIEIRLIRLEEAVHQMNIKSMLSHLGSKPSRFLDGVLWCIGKTISAGCYIFGYRLAMRGALIMEILGSGVYYRLARAAVDANKHEMALKLIEMAQQEERHEEFFESCLR